MILQESVSCYTSANAEQLVIADHNQFFGMIQSFLS